MTELETELRSIEQAKQGAYDKRTEHLDEKGRALFINRLIREDSPYLLQHAHNPVNWFPWGAEAFQQAKLQNKPVFLSIGYSTCHWCHVMEVESFDNTEVAEVLNRDFICIKMDREQYPDVDEIYMTGVQLVSGQGGWPMSSFLLADGRPFFGATYFPATAFISLLNQISQTWKERYDEIESSAGQIAVAIDRILSDRKQASSLHNDIVTNTIDALLQREDRSFGGLSGEPKFAQEPLLLLLLDHARRQRDIKVVGFVDRALEGMGQGGVYDQISGGFHRYSVDAQWLVPHFEKMLYNQSQLGLVYLEAYELTGKPFFKRICEQTLHYVERDMQLPEGGFYSATDADSEGREGTFFVWNMEELQQALEPAELEIVSLLYSPSEVGNFEGSNILNLSKPLAEFAEKSEDDNFYEILDRILRKLYEVREQRIHPLRDDKLIVAWTSAMIFTFARAASTLKNPAFLSVAEKAASFVWDVNVDAQHSLQRIYLNGAVSIPGQLEDYANFSQALIQLFDLTNKSEYLQNAHALMNVAIQEFWDTGNDGFFLGPEQQAGLQLTRSRNASDGATLSAVATTFHCLLQLDRRSALLTNNSGSNDMSFRERIDLGIASLLGNINDNPLSYPGMLKIMTELEQGSRDPVQWLDCGRAKLSCYRAEMGADDELIVQVDLVLMEGWHISSTNEAKDTVSPIEISISNAEHHWRMIECEIPPANAELNIGGVGCIPVYENELSMQAILKRTSLAADDLSHSVELQVSLQLCNHENCLLPNSIFFRI